MMNKRRKERCWVQRGRKKRERERQRVPDVSWSELSFFITRIKLDLIFLNLLLTDNDFSTNYRK